MLSPMSGIDEVLKKCSGSPTAVARKVTDAGIKCLRQDVEYWKRAGYVTTRFAPTVSELFNVPLHKLNPAVYPRRLVA